MDVDFFDDDKIVMIEEDCGIKGGYVAIRLMAMVYKHGYFMEWTNTSQFTIAKRVGKGITGALVMDILRSCLKHGLFNEKLFDGHMVLTSNGIQKQWLLVMQQLRRKVEVSSEYWLVNSEETPVTSEETTPPTTFSTQKESKVNEKKLDEIKENVVPDKPAPQKKVIKPKIEEPPEPYWQELVNAWFDFGLEKFKVKPSFDGEHPKIFKRIIQRLKKRAAEKNIEWNQDTGPRRLRFFLENAFTDKWLSEHFLLSNLEKQFDKIIQNQSSKKQTAAPVADLDYLFERFMEGGFDSRLIMPDHFIELSKKAGLIITPEIIKKRMGQLIGGNKHSDMELYKHYQGGAETKLVLEDKPQLMRMAVLEYFLKEKNKNLATT